LTGFILLLFSNTAEVARKDAHLGFYALSTYGIYQWLDYRRRLEWWVSCMEQHLNTNNPTAPSTFWVFQEIC